MMGLSLKHRLGWGLLATFILSIIIAFGLNVFLSAQHAARKSAQFALMREAAGLLKAYHERHGRYPDSMEEFEFTFPDGGKQALLETLNYQLDGEKFKLWFRGDPDDYAYVIESDDDRIRGDGGE